MYLRNLSLLVLTVTVCVGCTPNQSDKPANPEADFAEGLRFADLAEWIMYEDVVSPILADIWLPGVVNGATRIEIRGDADTRQPTAMVVYDGEDLIAELRAAPDLGMEGVTMQLTDGTRATLMSVHNGSWTWSIVGSDGAERNATVRPDEVMVPSAVSQGFSPTLMSLMQAGQQTHPRSLRPVTLIASSTVAPIQWMQSTDDPVPSNVEFGTYMYTECEASDPKVSCEATPVRLSSVYSNLLPVEIRLTTWARTDLSVLGDYQWTFETVDDCDTFQGNMKWGGFYFATFLTAAAMVVPQAGALFGAAGVLAGYAGVASDVTGRFGQAPSSCTKLVSNEAIRAEALMRNRDVSITASWDWQVAPTADPGWDIEEETPSVTIQPFRSGDGEQEPLPPVTLIFTYEETSITERAQEPSRYVAELPPEIDEKVYPQFIVEWDMQFTIVRESEDRGTATVRRRDVMVRGDEGQCIIMEGSQDGVEIQSSGAFDVSIELSSRGRQGDSSTDLCQGLVLQPTSMILRVEGLLSDGRGRASAWIEEPGIEGRVVEIELLRAE